MLDKERCVLCLLAVALCGCSIIDCKEERAKDDSCVPQECLMLFMKYGAKEISQERLKCMVNGRYQLDYRLGALSLVEDQEFIMWKVSDAELGDCARKMLDDDHLSVLNRYSKRGAKFKLCAGNMQNKGEPE